MSASERVTYSFRDPEPGDLFQEAGRNFYIEIEAMILAVRDGTRPLGWLVRAKDGTLWRLAIRDDCPDGCRFRGRPHRAPSGPGDR